MQAERSTHGIVWLLATVLPGFTPGGFMELPGQGTFRVEWSFAPQLDSRGLELGGGLGGWVLPAAQIPLSALLLLAKPAGPSKTSDQQDPKSWLNSAACPTNNRLRRAVVGREARGGTSGAMHPQMWWLAAGSVEVLHVYTAALPLPEREVFTNRGPGGG